MLNDLSVVIESEDVDTCPFAIFIGGPELLTMENNVIALGNRPFEIDALSRIFVRHLFEVLDERLFAVRDERIVLDVHVPGISLDGFGRFALIEQEIVERLRSVLVALELVSHCGSL
jgi:hypothetical protein